MLRLAIASATYAGLGLAGGLFYREMTRELEVVPATQLAVVHTHLLALGMTVFLIVLALEKLFALSRSKTFTWFFWLYNAGMAFTVSMMVWQGLVQISGGEGTKMMAGISGLGHMLLTAALACFFVALIKAVRRPAPVARELRPEPVAV